MKEAQEENRGIEQKEVIEEREMEKAGRQAGRLLRSEGRRTQEDLCVAGEAFKDSLIKVLCIFERTLPTTLFRGHGPLRFPVCHVGRLARVQPFRVRLHEESLFR